MWITALQFSIALALAAAPLSACGDKVPAKPVVASSPASAPQAQTAQPATTPPAPTPRLLAELVGRTDRQKAVSGLSVGAWLRSLDGLGRHDLDAALKIYAADTRWHAMDATQATTEGRPALRAVWDGLKAGFPDLRARPTRFVLLDDGLFLVESIGLGTHDGALGEHAATGRDFAVRQAQLSQVKGSVITESWVYSDTAALLSQLGFVHGGSPMATVDEDAPVTVTAGPPNAANERAVRRLYARLSGAGEGATGPAADLSKVIITDHAQGVRGSIKATAFATPFPGASPTLGQLHSAGDTVIATLVYEGAKDPKGSPVTVTALHVLDFDANGLLTRVAVYYDTIARRLVNGTWPPPAPGGP